MARRWANGHHYPQLLSHVNCVTCHTQLCSSDEQNRLSLGTLPLLSTIVAASLSQVRMWHTSTDMGHSLIMAVGRCKPPKITPHYNTFRYLFPRHILLQLIPLASHGARSKPGCRSCSLESFAPFPTRRSFVTVLSA
jgi:hypothetical protein